MLLQHLVHAGGVTHVDVVSRVMVDMHIALAAHVFRAVQPVSRLLKSSCWPPFPLTGSCVPLIELLYLFYDP